MTNLRKTHRRPRPRLVTISFTVGRHANLTQQTFAGHGLDNGTVSSFGCRRPHPSCTPSPHLMRERRFSPAPSRHGAPHNSQDVWATTVAPTGRLSSRTTHQKTVWIRRLLHVVYDWQIRFNANSRHLTCITPLCMVTPRPSPELSMQPTMCSPPWIAVIHCTLQ